MKSLSCIAILLGSTLGFGQGKAAEPQPPTSDLSGILSALQPRSIGPVTMAGRITGLAVYEKDPRIFYVASASGGLFKTDNDGLSFSAVFDKEATISLGAVAISQINPDVIWVGTGENTSRNSVAWGDGVYKSTDGGKTWTNMGLKETMHIGQILLDPRDPNVVYVGALGRLWGKNPERGVYKSTDGGKTWNLVLQINDDTGCSNLVMDPKNPDTILASMWQRRRYAYDFSSGGPGCGLYKSTDAGKTWRKVNKGFPKTTLGHIGVSYFRKDPKIVIATVEYKPDAKAEAKLKDKRPADNGVVKTYAGGTFRSKDGGETWEQINFLNPRPFYFSLPVQDPEDEKRFYLGSDSLWVTDDSGKTFKSPRTSMHPDHHAAWINPKDNHHLLWGTDGGVFESRDRGVTWRMLNSMAVGQFYAVAFDYRRPYWVYGGLQDNGSWGIPTQTRKGGVSFYDATLLSYGDGFHVQVDPEDWRTVYSESQGGSTLRTDLETGASKGIQPRGEAGEKLRFNWSTPFILSPHNSKTVYYGANRLFKSVNRGDTWKAISPDLTTNVLYKQQAGKFSVTPEDTGAEKHCTIITISESPLQSGLLYVGTDDGLLQMSKDDGRTWTEVGANIKGLPRATWCSRVLASKWEVGRVYATFDGHRNNDFNPYVFVSEDFGKTWSPLTTGLPVGDSFYVVTEGERNSDLLYLGGELGLRVSTDRGKNWAKFKGNFPTVAVHDLKVHPRELDLIVGTHGRAIWTIDVGPLETLTKKDLEKDVAVAKPQNVVVLGRISRLINTGDGVFMAPNTQPGTRIYYFLKQAAKDVKIKVSDASGERVEVFTGDAKAGLNVQEWNGRLDGRLVGPGDYRVVVVVDGKEYVTSVRVEKADAGY